MRFDNGDIGGVNGAVRVHVAAEVRSIESLAEPGFRLCHVRSADRPIRVLSPTGMLIGFVKPVAVYWT